MHAKVKEFLDKKRREEAIAKAEYLISLGLEDEDKRDVIRKYSSIKSAEFSQYDKEKKMYYCDVELMRPVEVTDEEYKEILKYAPLKSNSSDDVIAERGISWASVIYTIAQFGLIIDIGVTIIQLLIFGLDSLWVTLGISLSYVILCYPFLMGFAKIVEAAEKFLKEK